MNRELYLVSYDISDDRIRAKVSRHLLGYTTGRQKSVYECWLTVAEFDSLCEWFSSLVELSDIIHMYKLPPSKVPHYLGIASSLSISPIIIV